MGFEPPTSQESTHSPEGGWVPILGRGGRDGKKKAPQAWGVEPAGAKRLLLPPPFPPPLNQWNIGTISLFPFLKYRIYSIFTDKFVPLSKK